VEYFSVQGTSTKSGGKGKRRKSQNKMNKSFLLSGGRKNDRFGSGFKPATLPDFQNGNAKRLRNPENEPF
jgi:hypothetical protein